jgi:siroheme decarboxylase
MDEKDRLLLTCLHNGLPLTSKPFDVLAAKIGADNADILVRIQRLKKEGTFGGIRAVLDPRAFHYQSAWVAMRFDPEKQESRHLSPNATSTGCGNFEISDRPTEALWQHPGVIYGCEREHEFNVWFFIAAPADHDLELHVRCLEKLTGARSTLFLPVRKVFKGTDLLSSLNAGTFPAMNERFEKRQKDRSSDLTAEEAGMIRQLQEPFPLTDEPYQKIALDLGITEAQALERMKSLVNKGCLKRIGSFSRSPVRIGQERQAPAEAVLKDWPSAVAPEARTLVVWQIPEEKLERIGPEIAEFREVLYADRRPTYPEFPYSLYTMIRAETAEELELVTRRMQDRIGKWPHRVLMTTRELKKAEMKYFPKELEAWWQGSRHVAETAFN